MLATHSISPAIARQTNWWIRVSSFRQASALSCTPVISSICDSLKSVVMQGCVNAEPSAVGWDVKARLPAPFTRSDSFSTPRRMPARRSAESAFSRSRMRDLEPTMESLHAIERRIIAEIAGPGRRPGG